jgi:hypothetical protein
MATRHDPKLTFPSKIDLEDTDPKRQESLKRFREVLRIGPGYRIRQIGVDFLVEAKPGGRELMRGYAGEWLIILPDGSTEIRNTEEVHELFVTRVEKDPGGGGFDLAFQPALQPTARQRIDADLSQIRPLLTDLEQRLKEIPSEAIDPSVEPPPVIGHLVPTWTYRLVPVGDSYRLEPVCPIPPDEPPESPRVPPAAPVVAPVAPTAPVPRPTANKATVPVRAPSAPVTPSSPELEGREPDPTDPAALKRAQEEALGDFSNDAREDGAGGN